MPKAFLWHIHFYLSKNISFISILLFFEKSYYIRISTYNEFVFRFTRNILSENFISKVVCVNFSVIVYTWYEHCSHSISLWLTSWGVSLFAIGSSNDKFKVANGKSKFTYCFIYFLFTFVNKFLNELHRRNNGVDWMVGKYISFKTKSFITFFNIVELT